MKTLEVMKKFKFNTKKGKSEWMVIKNKKQVDEDIRLEVKAGEIGRTYSYKYLGKGTL